MFVFVCVRVRVMCGHGLTRTYLGCRQLGPQLGYLLGGLQWGSEQTRAYIFGVRRETANTAINQYRPSGEKEGRAFLGRGAGMFGPCMGPGMPLPLEGESPGEIP